MHPRGRLGGVDPDEDAFDDEEKTDPHISGSALEGGASASPHGSNPDPVLAALAELDGEGAIEQARTRLKGNAASPGRTPARTPPNELGFDGPAEPTVRTNAPVFADELDTALGDPTKPTPASPSPARKLRLPLPGESKRQSATSLDKDAASPPGFGRTPPPDAGPSRPTPDPPVFSSAELIERLAEPAVEKKRKGSLWGDYKEVIVTAAIGLLVLAGVIAYRTLDTPSPVRMTAVLPRVKPEPPVSGPAGPAREPAPRQAAAGESGAHPVGAPATVTAIETPAPGTLSGRPATSGTGNVFARARGVGSEPAPVKAQEPVAANDQQGTAPQAPNSKPRTKTPMLSVVSTPRGALVEIDGVVYGSTPVVMPSPTGKEKLRVKLMLDGYRKWESVVQENEAGHFSVNVVLKAAR